jgi:peptide/nickel transport system substrate-binding protein
MRRLLLAAMCAAALAGPASAQTIRIALRQDPDILDPTLSRTYVGRIVYAALCDKLFDLDAQLKIVPQLALSYEWADGKNLVIKLRPGVSFHDGEKLDAAAVKYSLERHLTMQGSFRRSEVNTMERVEVVDPLTVRIVLKEASAPFLAQLTDRAGMVVSPKAAEAAGKDFGLHPVCAGPFRFVERVPQDRIVLERFSGYWNAPAIHFDRVIYRPISDSSVRLANLQAGSIELTETVATTDVEAVKKDARLKLVFSDELGYQGITLNIANGTRAQTPLGQDARVRRAFELAIDREAVVQVVYNGLFKPTAQAVPPDSPFYIAAIKPPGRDVARARALLKEAGVTTPLAVELTVANEPEQRQVGEVIQSMVKEAGFEVRLNAMEFASSLQAATRGDFQAYLVGWSGRVDADGNLWSFIHTGAAQNDAKYSNPQVDALLDEARRLPDLAQRRALYEKMWALVHQDLPILYLWHRKNIVGMNAKLSGFVAVPDGMIRLQGVRMAP